MIFIKFILIFILTITFILFAFSYKLRTFQKLNIVIGYLFVFFLIVYPQYADQIAHIFSMERGADLIVYISIALSFLVNVILFIKQKNFNQMLTKIVRESAKKNAKKC